MGCCSATAGDKPVWFPDFEDKLPSLKGKRVAITGTTSGTGYIAAATCAKKGAEVLLLNRASSRATKAVQRLKDEVPGGVFISIEVDLQDFGSVRGVRAALEKKCGSDASIDVLACNAGVMALPDKATKDGFDVQMQTNHLSHFLLVKQLLPALKRAKGGARIVNHSSVARNGKPLEAKYLQKNGGALGGDGAGECFTRYHHSKLANMVFHYALDAKLTAAGLPIMSVACAPGFSRTSLVDNMKSETKFGCVMEFLFNCVKDGKSQTAEDGTMPLLTCIAGPDVQAGDFNVPGSSDEFTGPPRVMRKPLLDKKEAVCTDEESQTMLWAESEKAIGESFDVTSSS